MTESPSTFQEALATANIELPGGFRDPAWDPIPLLNKWNEHYSPPDGGIPHWDGNMTLVVDPEIGHFIHLQVHVAESGV